MDGTNLNAVELFTYLGSVISNDATLRKDLYNRLSKANNSFGRLSKSMEESVAPSFHEHPAVVVPTILFRQCCLHSFPGIKRQDYVSNEEILKRASLPSIESISLQVQMR